MLGIPRNKITLSISINYLILLAAITFTLLFNGAFFQNAAEVYGDSIHGWSFIASLAVFLFATTVLMLSLLCFRITAKPLLIILFLAGASASYYMNHYNIVLDTSMLTNVFKTDSKEVKDLLTLALVGKILVLGVLPSFVLLHTKIESGSFIKELRKRLFLIGGALLGIVVTMLPFTADYSSYFREHKILRFYANPVTLVYSSLKLASETLSSVKTGPRTPLGMTAHIPANDHTRELIVLVVGEAARADHFSLNGYERLTNPLLARENVINFSEVSSCGTATAHSVPCMFSEKSRADFDVQEAPHSENLLDLLKHAGVNVLWRDNNSDSKGVAQGVEYQDFQTSNTNPDCDTECRDIGMLDGLDHWIDAHPNGDITIVLHQMGNHGPAYSKRYPPEFEKFLPVCRTSELADCTKEEINNAYDNAILYTDYFLSQVIAFLKTQDQHFATALLYMADHGESLGENGLYLHGLPYLLAPDTQKHVASLMWFGSHYPVDRQKLISKSQEPLSHDNYFHTVLGLMEIETPEYQRSLDWLSDSRLTEEPASE